VTLRRARHRAGQFFGALRPRVDAAERADAYRYLTGNERRIFESMMLRDQQHGIEVLRRVRASGGDGDAALCTAALLHDCGKGDVRLWHRVAHVVLGTVAPGLRARIISEHGAGWRRAMWRLAHHAEISARMVEAAGADPEAVRFIREQERERPDARLALLQAADEA
jgi:hypothetical protein